MTNKYADQSTDSEHPIDALVTGATGLLGRWLIPELTRRGLVVLAPIRNARERRDELHGWVEAHGGDARRLRVVEGDLDVDGLGLAPEERARLATASLVFHLGARFAWGLSSDVARRTNVDGSVRVVELAASIPGLKRLVLVGGYRIGPRLDRHGQRFVPNDREIARAGAYEASKHEAHRVAVARARELGVPYSAVHPSTVIGDSTTGESTQLVGLGETVLALARREMPARVGSRETWVPLVTVDFVARVLATLALDPDAAGRELVLLDPRTPPLDALIDRAASLLAVPAPRIRLPIGLVRALPERLTKTPRETLAFLDDARYPLEETEAWLAQHRLAHPDPMQSFDRWVLALARPLRLAPALNEARIPQRALG